MADRNVTDTQGRVWRRCAIPDGVVLVNGQSVEKIREEERKRKKRRKDNERKSLAKAKKKARQEREKARKEWEEKPRIIYTPMGNKR